MIDRIVSNLTHIMTQIELIGFTLFITGVVILLLVGAWLMLDELKKERE